jgi:tetratricopeptide (TPR) repeat protein
MYDVYQSLGHARNASLVPSISREAAVKLRAGTYITGNFQKAGNKIRIIVKLIDTGTDELLWTGKVDGLLSSEYIDLADSLSQQLKSYLEIRVLEKKVSLDFREAFTNSADAYRKYIEGTQLFMEGQYLRAVESLKEAYRIDTTFTLAAFYIANSYNMIDYNSLDSVGTVQVKLWIQKSLDGKERLPAEYQLWVEMWRAFFITKNSDEVLKFCGQLEESDIKSRYYWFDIGITYSSAFEMWTKAAEMFEKIQKINLEWGNEWRFLEYYKAYGLTLFKLGKYEQSEKLYLTGLKYFPDYGPFIYGLARCALVTNDTTKATELIKKRIALGKEAGWTKASVEGMLATLYTDANLFDEAEKHYRNALGSDPANYWRIVNLAAFLIYYNRNVCEGMTLADKVIKISPTGSTGLWIKGYGYYREGKYAEALDYLVRVQQSSLSINAVIEKQILMVRDSISNQK